MSYQPGGGYGQQPGASGQPYGQQYSGYGQQSGGQQAPQSYGQPSYGGGQQSYGQQPQQSQQSPGRYGYGAAPSTPAASGGHGLPANVQLILAAAVGGLGLLAMFCGFLAGASAGEQSVPVFGSGSQFGAPYIAIVVAAFLALTYFLPGGKTPPVAVVAALTVAGTVVTLFAMVAKGDSGFDTGSGAIILLVAGILMSIAAVLWLLIDAGLVKTAGTTTSPSAGTPAASAAPTPTPSAPSSEPQAPSYGSYGATQYGPSYGQGQSSPGAGQPTADPGAAPSGGPSYGSYGSAPGSDSATRRSTTRGSTVAASPVEASRATSPPVPVTSTDRFRYIRTVRVRRPAGPHCFL